MTQPDDPADTRMMGIVHSALRRDLVRARLVVAEPTPLTGERRTALADHVRWLMDFLHHHHTNEDDGLYPLVLEKNPAAGELLAVMDADHHRITPRILELDVAARSYRCRQGRVRRRAAGRPEALETDMCPHLEREEREMMPVVALVDHATASGGTGRTPSTRPKSMKQLADEGHWLIDNLDPERRDVVVHLVPAVPRFILLNFLGGPYKKKATLLWGGTPAAAVPSLSADEYPRYAA